MAYVKPLGSDDCADAKADIEWQASATEFTASSILSLAQTELEPEVNNFVAERGYKISVEIEQKSLEFETLYDAVMVSAD
ncbi:MAG: hypothetical protein KTR32_38075 [Granulosicoccus sp.]|nr:hypothetical protein [Granulosicoccus sp.]